jgi:SPP1 family predicted phage head-tail adaptor
MIGKLNQRAVIAARTQTSDGAGGVDGAWSEIGHIWAGIAPLTGGDTYGPDAMESRARYRLSARRNGLLASGHRLDVEGRLFLIHAILDEGSPAQLVTLLCEELP